MNALVIFSCKKVCVVRQRAIKVPCGGVVRKVSGQCFFGGLHFHALAVLVDHLLGASVLVREHPAPDHHIGPPGAKAPVPRGVVEGPRTIPGIILEDALEAAAVGHGLLALALALAPAVPTAVRRAVGHLALPHAVHLALLPASVVGVRRADVDALPVLLPVQPVPLIGGAVGVHRAAHPGLLAVHKAALVLPAAVGELAMAVHKVALEPPGVPPALLGVVQHSKPIPEAFLPEALIDLPGLLGERALAVLLAAVPVPLVAVARLGVGVGADAVHHAVLELALVDVPVGPLVPHNRAHRAISRGGAAAELGHLVRR
eukprot:RCo042523